MTFSQPGSIASPPAEPRRLPGLPGRLNRGLVAGIIAVVLAMAAPQSLFARDSFWKTNAPGSAALAPTNAAAVVSSNTGTNRMEDLDDKYKLAVGDHLSFRIIEDEDDPRVLLITDSGEIDVPYIGRHAAVGKTCRQLAKELKVDLEKKYYYQATVIVSVDGMATRGLIYLVGPVGRPGPLEIPREETLTLSKAIMRAGGFTDLADEKHVRVTRDAKPGSSERQVIMVNVSRILNDGDSDKDIVMEPGDLVYIPERMFRF